MKETYIKPILTVVATGLVGALMAASGLSDTFHTTVDSSLEYKTGDVLTKYNKTTGLWDTTWNDDDEDDDED